jgi:hypothetical protein
MKEIHSSPATNGEGRVSVLECANKVCIWFEETKLVQRLPNGEVPIREHEKEFQPLTEGAKARARASIENVQELEERAVREIRWQ